MIARAVVLLFLPLALAGCQGLAAPAAVEGPPSARATPPERPSPSPTHPPVHWPQSLDPAYIRALVHTDDAGREHPLRRWAPRSVMNHCFEGIVGAALEIAQHAAAQMTAIAGAASSGSACNIRWRMEPGLGGEGEMLYADTDGRTAPDGVTIIGATIRFRDAHSVGFGAIHESGHALGLGHSPRREDKMWPYGGPENFSAAERLVLAAMYPLGSAR